MRCPPERQGGQVGQGEGRAADINFAALHLPTQHRGNLEVYQFWRAQSFPAQAGTGTVAVRAVIAKGGGQDAGVNDDHDRRAASLPPSSAEPNLPSDHPPGQGPPQGSVHWPPR